jgi:hypothetical protein
MEKHTDSQCSKILHDLIAGKRITQIDALEKYGCFRLSARIKDLRKDGWVIKTEIVRTRSRKRIAQYYMENELL